MEPLLGTMRLLRKFRAVERVAASHRQMSTKPPKDFVSDTIRAGTNDPSGKMRGWQIHEYGGVEILRCSDNIKIPTITTPNEVCVEVHTASVNPIDVAMMGMKSSPEFNNDERSKGSRKRTAF